MAGRTARLIVVRLIGKIGMMKRVGIVVTLLLILAPQAVLALAPGAPDIYMEAQPAKADVAAGGSVKVTIVVYSQEGFEGNVKLELTDPPQGVTATFDPNPVNVPAFDLASSDMTVTAASDAAQGTVTLTVTGTGVEDPTIKRTVDIELNIAGEAQPPQEQPPQQQPPQEQPPQEQPPQEQPPQQPVEVKTTTVTTTVSTTVTTTVTTTSISTSTILITTKTPTITTKTTAGPGQVTDYTLPLVTAVVVVVLVAVAALALRRGR